MTATVSKQMTFVPIKASGLWVTKQMTFVPIIDTALNPGGSDRRRQAMVGSF